MHNCFYSLLVNEKTMYSKQFIFQKGNSTEHTIVQLADQIHGSFENDNYTCEVFSDLPKAFDITDHAILLKKLENCGMKGTNLVWFRNYLTNRNSTFKSLMKEKAIYKIVHVECHWVPLFF